MGFLLSTGAELLDPYTDTGAPLLGLTAVADEVSAGGLKRAARALLSGRDAAQGHSVLAVLGSDRGVKIVAEDPGIEWTIQQLNRAPGAARYASVFRRDGAQWAQTLAVKMPGDANAWRTPLLVAAAAGAVLLVATRRRGAR